MRKLLEKFLIGDAKENQRRNYVWNMMAGLLNAAEAVVLSAVITRITGLADAGILTIAFAVANLYGTIGKFGIRNYQVTDTDNRYSFRSYYITRVITVALMIFVSCIHCIKGLYEANYSFYKAGTIFCMCMIYAVEAFEDVFAALFQQNNRLDIAGKIFIIRWFGILTAYTITLYMWKNLLLSSVIALAVCIIIFALCIFATYPHYQNSIGDKYEVGIFKECIPLCLASFLSYYVCNASKYAIDEYMSDEVQACFGFISMPVFVISLLSSFIYQPQLVRISTLVKQQKIREVMYIIVGQLIKIGIITVICLMGAFYLGVPILSWLFHTELTQYKKQLLIMIASGGMLALANYFTAMLTVFRSLNLIVAGYLGTAAIAAGMMPYFVRQMGSSGAALINFVDMSLLVLILGIVLAVKLYGREKA